MIIQWAMLKFNNLDESSQFNSIYEAIGDNFRRFITLNGELEKFDEYYEKLGWKILFLQLKEISKRNILLNYSNISHLKLGTEQILLL